MGEKRSVPGSCATRNPGVLESGERGYAPTEMGQKLCAALAPLQRWADDWADHLT